MNILGFKVPWRSDEEDRKRISFSPKEDQQQSVEVVDYGSAAGGAVASFMDLTQVATSETELINRYRGMAVQPEISAAIDHIINEMVFIDEGDDTVSIITDDIEFTDKVKKKIEEEFNLITDMMDFSNNAYEIIRRWYIDGIIRYHAIVDEGKEKNGIVALRYIDPRKIKKVKVFDEITIPGQHNVVVKQEKEEFFVYSDTGFNTVIEDNATMMGRAIGKSFGQDQIKISADCVVTSTSGLYDINNRFVLSYLDQAFRPLNSLRIEEDATVIYRVVRAPERRAFYIDVSGMPPSKADSHVKQMMNNHNKKMQYNSQTGEIVDANRVLTMTDDYWLPRKDGTRGTEIVPLQAGANLGEMEDVVYFQKALYKSLKVPVSRLESETGSFLGRQSEISREEQNFALFVGRLRSRFTNVFDELLERQLVLKKIIQPEDWKKIKNKLRYDFKKNNFFAELREMEIFRERVTLLAESDPHTGKYFSRREVWKKVMSYTDAQIEEMEKEMDEERKKGFYDDFGAEGAGAAGEDDGEGGVPFGVGNEVPAIPETKPKKPDALNKSNINININKDVL